MNKLFLLIALTALLASAALGQAKKGVKLKGQVVCSTCWFEAPDREATPYGNAADIKCAAECAGEGVPQSLAVQDEKGFTLYTLEKGSYPMKGKDFLDLVPNVVEIGGDVRTEGDKRFVKVNSLKVLAAKAELPVLKSDDAVLALRDLTGSPQSLAGYRGRVVVLNFWATWCEPCKKEMPDLSAIQNDYAALGVQVIGAAGDAPSDSAKVLKFIREYKLNFPVWLGGSTDDMTRFGLGTVLPATVIIDKNGKIVWREVGVIKPVELRKELDRILLPTVAAAEKQAKADKPKSKNASLVPA